MLTKQKFITYLFFLIVLIALVLCSIRISKDPLHFHQAVHNTGDFFSGQTAEVKFDFKNISLNTVKITALKTSCRCEQFVSSPSLLRPFEQGIILGRIHFDRPVGKVKEFCWIETSANINYKLETNANIIDSFDVNPAQIAFPDLYWDQEASQTLTIKGHHGEKLPASLNILEMGSQSLSGNVVERSDQCVTITVRLKPKSIGPFLQRLALKSSNSIYPEIFVPVHSRILGALQPEQDHLYLGSQEMGKAIHCKFSFRKRNEYPTKITKVELYNEFEKIKYRVIENGDRLDLELELKAQPKRGLINKVISVYTTEPVQTTFIQVVAFVG